MALGGRGPWWDDAVRPSQVCVCMALAPYNKDTQASVDLTLKCCGLCLRRVRGRGQWRWAAVGRGRTMQSSPVRCVCMLGPCPIHQAHTETHAGKCRLDFEVLWAVSQARTRAWSVALGGRGPWWARPRRSGRGPWS
jgi:hypothetical protein